MALKEGSPAPDFTLPSTSGEDFKLHEQQTGKPCIIYFYPKDFTPGCTKEACDFRDAFTFFKNLDIEIYGISKDSMESHLKFKKENELPFDLLVDKDGKVAAQYKAQVPVIKMTKRITYLLDSDLKIAAVYDDLFGARKHITKMIEKVKQ